MADASDLNQAASVQRQWATETCAWLIGVKEGLAEMPEGTDPVRTRRVRALRLSGSMLEDILEDAGPDATADEISIAYARHVLEWCARKLGFAKIDDRR